MFLRALAIDYFMASEAGHGQGEGLLHGYDTETFLDGKTEMPIFKRPQNC